MSAAETEWDLWRREYATSSPAVQRDVYDRIFVDWRDQARFDAPALARFLARIGEPVRSVAWTPMM